jgi:hypothetical protein
MSNQAQKKKDPKRGKRRPLLFQQRFSEQVFWPCLLSVAICVALFVWNPADLELYRSSLVVTLVGTGSILVITLFFRLRAYVQCRRNELRVQCPFYRLDVPYRAIKTTRPSELYHVFPPVEQRWTQRRFLEPLWGKTMIVVEMDQLPGSRFWLRLWAGKYLLCPDTVGLVIPVRDWMAFRAELDEFKFRHQR